MALGLTCECQRARKWPLQEMAWFDGLISCVARELLRTFVTLTMFFIWDDIVGRLTYRWSLKYVLFFRCHPISYFLYYISQSIFMFSFLHVVYLIQKHFSYCIHLETLSYFKSSDPQYSVPNLIHLKMITNLNSFCSPIVWFLIPLRCE